MKARDNPFQTSRIMEIRFRPQSGDWDELLARLEKANWRGAIIGPEGSGKTTLLEDLTPVLENRGFQIQSLFFNRQNRRLSREISRNRFFPSDAVLCDGAEQLSRFDWLHLRWAIKNAGALLITAHTPGLLPEIWRTSTSPELLREIVSELSEELGENAARELWEQHKGNLRLALRELYDRKNER